MIKLHFGLGNAKLAATIATFALPAGHSCPFACDCQSKSDRFTGKITDGKKTKFRCFSATSEARATTVRNARWRNWEALKEAKTVQGMADIIQSSLPFGVQYVRMHVSGDFFNETYFKAWLNVALNNPGVVFYGYTKALAFVVKFKSQFPANFRLIASKGGTQDALIAKYNLVFAEVCFSEEEARRKELEIDHDDHLAIAANKSFGLLLHATQPPGSVASAAWQAIRNTIGGYTRGTKRGNVVTPGAKSVSILVQ